MKEQTAKANSYQVTSFDQFNHTLSVKETIDHNDGLPRQEYWVLLPDGCWDCGKFQAFRMPCSHVITPCSFAHQNALTLLFPIYRAGTLLDVYKNPFPAIEKEDY